MARRFLTLLALVVVCATSADSKPKYDPFKVPRDQLVGRVKTVALAELSGVSQDYARSDSVKANFESLLTAELEHAGFKVLPSSVYEQLRKESLDSLGGIFDPKTGTPDTTKAREARRWSLSRLRQRHQADALLHPHVITMPASFSSGTAHWDGASQRLFKGMSGALGIFDKRSGTMSALSLAVLIEDMDQNDLYMDSGGLSLRSRVKGVGFEDLPEDSLYWNPRRNEQAVRLALGALTRTGEK